MPPAPRTPQDRRTARKTTTAKKTTAPRRTATKAAATQGTDDKYAATAWGSALGGAEDLEVPSGQLCLVKRPGVQGLMEEGVLHDLDSLTALVDSKHIKRVKQGNVVTEQVDVASLMKDTKSIDNLLHTVDRVVCAVVLKPNVQMTPNDPTSREVGVVYCDMIDLMDKMFIFQFAVGGTRGLESFREQLGEAVGGVGTQ